MNCNLPEEGWNVLADEWLEVMTLNAEVKALSPLQVLRSADSLHCIVVASPLDLFAVHRFLLTLLYWKAELAGGIEFLRDSLMGGNIPEIVITALETEKDHLNN